MSDKLKRASDGLTVVLTRVPRDFAGKLERNALRDGRSLSAYVRRLLERAVFFGIGTDDHGPMTMNEMRRAARIRRERGRK